MLATKYKNSAFIPTQTKTILYENMFQTMSSTFAAENFEAGNLASPQYIAHLNSSRESKYSPNIQIIQIHE